MTNQETHPGQQVDELMLQLAKNMFESGAPVELWARMVCEARGVAHNLPSNPAELLVAVMADVATTHNTLNR